MTLTTTNNAGSNTLTKTNYIHAVTMTAGFTASPTTARRNAIIKFTNTSTGSPTSFFWKFGDGNTSALQNPTHSYQNRNMYIVSLTITKLSVSTTITKSNFIIIN